MDFATQQALFHYIPEHARYADFADDLRIEDVPSERFNLLKELLLTHKNKPFGLDAAMLLSSWGVDEGFNYLEWFVCEQPVLAESWNPHRLRGYDDTYKRMLDAIIGYWSRKSTEDFEKKSIGAAELARNKIFKSVIKIIDLSNSLPFGIEYFFWLIKDKNFTEYIPALKTHLEAILKNPQLHHWKIADCSHLLMKFDSAFVTQALAKHGKTLADYPNK